MSAFCSSGTGRSSAKPSRSFDREPGFTLRRVGRSRRHARRSRASTSQSSTTAYPTAKARISSRELHRLNLAAKAMVLTSSIDPRDAEGAIRRGAVLVLNKLADLEEITPAVIRIQQSESS
jgi:hypothetical protein